jgi:hypothetical protein
MREHHLYVMALEEFPVNTEFVGRNFNAGEVIQLVLRSAVSFSTSYKSSPNLPS